MPAISRTCPSWGCPRTSSRDHRSPWRGPRTFRPRSTRPTARPRRRLLRSPRGRPLPSPSPRPLPSPKPRPLPSPRPLRSPRRTKAPSPRVPFVGLTGGLGAGKSEALRGRGELGAATLSTDAVVAELLSGEELRDEIVSRLGPEVAPDGSLDRSAGAGGVFGEEDTRRWLGALLGRGVGGRVMAGREEVEPREPPPPAAVVEVP